jgi:heme-degrading monooxygenase HmoA
MYGTIARLQVKPGTEQQIQQLQQDFAKVHVPGYRTSLVYRSDADSNVYFLVVVFDSKDAYWANARSPEQDARYHQLRELLTADPEWHDGEVVAAVTQ